MKSLDFARSIIDNCDRELVKIFERRLKAVLHVLDYKRQNGLPIFQVAREKQVLEKVSSYLQDDRFSSELESLYSEILKISRQVQSRALFPFNIVLIGFMGSGKSTVGQELSKLLEMNYIDTDKIIEKNSNMSINEIFNKYGEVKFRDLETHTLESLQDVNNTIISCGGGIVLNPRNMDLIKKLGRVIWLKISPQEAFNRLQDDHTRPLIKDDFSLESLSNILDSRLSLYQAASDIIIDTDGKNPQNLGQEIIEKVLQLET